MARKRRRIPRNVKDAICKHAKLNPRLTAKELSIWSLKQLKFYVHRRTVTDILAQPEAWYPSSNHIPIARKRAPFFAELEERVVQALASVFHGRCLTNRLVLDVARCIYEADADGRPPSCKPPSFSRGWAARVRERNATRLAQDRPEVAPAWATRLFPEPSNTSSENRSYGTGPESCAKNCSLRAQSDDSSTTEPSSDQLPAASCDDHRHAPVSLASDSYTSSACNASPSPETDYRPSPQLKSVLSWPLCKGQEVAEELRIASSQVFLAGHIFILLNARPVQEDRLGARFVTGASILLCTNFDDVKLPPFFSIDLYYDQVQHISSLHVFEGYNFCSLWSCPAYDSINVALKEMRQRNGRLLLVDGHLWSEHLITSTGMEKLSAKVVKLCGSKCLLTDAGIYIMPTAEEMTFNSTEKRLIAAGFASTLLQKWCPKRMRKGEPPPRPPLSEACQWFQESWLEVSSVVLEKTRSVFARSVDCASAVQKANRELSETITEKLHQLSTWLPHCQFVHEYLRTLLCVV